MLEIVTAHIKPVCENYQGLEPYDAFTINDGIVQTDSEGIHWVTFFSKFIQTITEAQITELLAVDTPAHEEAAASKGYIIYHPGEISQDLTALSYCFWLSANDAADASNKFHHQKAVEFARTKGQDIYEFYRVRRFNLIRTLGMSAVQVREYQPDNSLRRVA